MKLHHFSLIFVIISFAFLVLVNVETRIYQHVVEEKELLDKAITKAVDDAMVCFPEEETGLLNINKDRVVNGFLDSLYSTMNFSGKDKEELGFYIPIMSVVTMDGFYIYFTGENKDDNNHTYYIKRWSEKYPFYYEDEDFIYKFTLTDNLTLYDKNGILGQDSGQKIFTLNAGDFIYLDEFAGFRELRPNSFLLKETKYYEVRKNTITSSIESVLTEYCFKYNEIAKKLGISYVFHLPSNTSEMSKSIESPSLLVLFQGYPLKSSKETVFNRFALSVSQTKKRQLYVIQQGIYSVYHKKTCNKLLMSGEPASQGLYTIKAAVEKGAFPCEDCCQNYE